MGRDRSGYTDEQKAKVQEAVEALENIVLNEVKGIEDLPQFYAAWIVYNDYINSGLSPVEAGKKLWPKVSINVAIQFMSIGLSSVTEKLNGRSNV